MTATIRTLYTARTNAVQAARSLATMPGMAAEWSMAVTAIRNIDAQIDRHTAQAQAAHNIGRVRGGLIANNGAN